VRNRDFHFGDRSDDDDVLSRVRERRYIGPEEIIEPGLLHQAELMAAEIDAQEIAAQEGDEDAAVAETADGTDEAAEAPDATADADAPEAAEEPAAEAPQDEPAEEPAAEAAPDGDDAAADEPAGDTA